MVSESEGEKLKSLEESLVLVQYGQGNTEWKICYSVTILTLKISCCGEKKYNIISSRQDRASSSLTSPWKENECCYLPYVLSFFSFPSLCIFFHLFFHLTQRSLSWHYYVWQSSEVKWVWKSFHYLSNLTDYGVKRSERWVVTTVFSVKAFSPSTPLDKWLPTPNITRFLDII